MYCKYCGASLPENTCFCTNCASKTDSSSDSRTTEGDGRIGYSERIVRA